MSKKNKSKAKKDRKKQSNQPQQEKRNVILMWYANIISGLAVAFLLLLVVHLATYSLDITLIGMQWTNTVIVSEIASAIAAIAVLILAKRKPYFYWREYGAWLLVATIVFPLLFWIGFRAINCWLDFSSVKTHETVVIRSEYTVVQRGKSTFDEDLVYVRSWRPDFSEILVAVQNWPDDRREKDSTDIPRNSPIIVRTKPGALGVEFVIEAVPGKKPEEVQQPVQTPPVQPPVETPLVQPPVETPPTPPVQPPVETPPVQPPVEVPPTLPVQPPVETPPVQPPVETQPTQPPAEVPPTPPVQPPVETPPVQPPVENQPTQPESEK